MNYLFRFSLSTRTMSWFSMRPCGHGPTVTLYSPLCHGASLNVCCACVCVEERAGSVFRSSLQIICSPPARCSAVSPTQAHIRPLTRTHSRDCWQQAGPVCSSSVCVCVRRTLGWADMASALSSYPHCCGIERRAAGGTASSLIMPALFSNPPS